MNIFNAHSIKDLWTEEYDEEDSSVRDGAEDDNGMVEVEGDGMENIFGHAGVEEEIC